MKKFVQIITAAIVSVGFIGGVASAASCDGVVIVNSGGNNTVEVSCTNITSVVINCVNNVNVATVNYQDGKSGTATVNGNGSVGDASTGAVINANDSVVNASAACAAVASPSPSVSPSVTPTASVTPGKGAVKPAVLPYTASNSAAEIVAISLAAAAGAVVASRLAIAAYRRFSVK